MRLRSVKRLALPSNRTRRNTPERDGHSAFTPVSSHPETEEEIVQQQAGCGLDDARLKLDTPPPAAKPIVSVDGEDVKDGRFHDDKAA